MIKRIFSGIQPSGDLHLGNYLGALMQWVNLQSQYKSIFCVVDLHAITVKQDPKVLKEKIVEIAKIYLAAGIDPQKSTIFQQSDISAHAELAWILNTITRMSDLNKMTQFKDKGGESENVGVGLFDYPVLMAADILLYDTEVVPVGEDQMQHVELARTLANRFNSQFGETLKVPAVKIQKEGARIMGLDNPDKKMSKSAASSANYIALTDAPDAAAKKIMRAVTDTGNQIVFEPKQKPGISNLLNIYSLLGDVSIQEIEKKYSGSGYGDFKKDLAEITKNFLADFQKRYNSIPNKKVQQILEAGSQKVQPIAEKTLTRVKKAVGFI